MTLSQKIMLLGDIGVGKTSIVRRLVFNKFDTQYKATIGVDIYSHNIELELRGNNQTIKLIIWDIDGDFGDSIFNHIYTKGANGALIIGDASRTHTYDSMLRLEEGFKEQLPGRPVALVLNKTDLAPQGYERDLPKAFIKPQIPFILTSAKTGENIEQAFNALSEMIALRET